MKSRFAISTLSLVYMVFFLGGCSSTLKPTKLNEDGYFNTGTVISADCIKIQKDFKDEYKALLYVKTDEKNEKLNEFFLDTFTNMEIFDEVKDKAGMENLVFEKDLSDSVSSVSDRIGLHNLQKEIGPFLVVETYVEWKGSYDFMSKLTAFDPQSGKEVLVLEKTAFNWVGLDKPLFYPLFNAFLDWARGEEIRTD